MFFFFFFFLRKNMSVSKCDGDKCLSRQKAEKKLTLKKNHNPPGDVFIDLAAWDYTLIIKRSTILLLGKM